MMAKNMSNSLADGSPKAPPRIENLRVQNYRALQDVEFKNITPLIGLLGPNGSGKSTVFDVFNFLWECFQHGLRHAWDRRGRARELKTRGQDGPIIIEIKYREIPKTPLITYHLAIDEAAKGPAVVEEWLQWRRGKQVGRPPTAKVERNLFGSNGMGLGWNGTSSVLLLFAADGMKKASAKQLLGGGSNVVSGRSESWLSGT